MCKVIKLCQNLVVVKARTVEFMEEICLDRILRRNGDGRVRKQGAELEQWCNIHNKVFFQLNFPPGFFVSCLGAECWILDIHFHSQTLNDLSVLSDLYLEQQNQSDAKDC